MDVFVEDTLIGGIMTTIFITPIRIYMPHGGVYPTPKKCGFYATIDNNYYTNHMNLISI